MAYKHSLNARGSCENLLKFQEDLKKIGYIAIDEVITNYTTIGVNSGESFSRIKNGEFDSLNNPFKRDYEFDIDNHWEYNAALGIAAMRDDNEPHIGEWVVAGGGGDITVLGSRGSLHKIDALGNNGNFSVEDYYPKRADNKVTDLRYDSKATAEEIINHFKPKEMNVSGAVTTATISGYVINGAAIARKIIGYKAPFSLRDGEIPSGTVYKPRSSKYYSADIKDRTCVLEKEIVEKWEAVYEEEEVTLTIGSRDAIVTVGRGKISVRGNVILYSTLSAIYNKLVAATGDEIGGWEVHILDDLRFIRIGCKDEDNRVSLKEIRSVIATYEKLNK